MAEWQDGLPADESDGLAQQQTRHPLRQEHQMTLIKKRTVLTQQADQFSMEWGLGNHWGLVWCENTKPPWLPAHPMTKNPCESMGSWSCVSQVGKTHLEVALCRKAVARGYTVQFTTAMELLCPVSTT